MSLAANDIAYPGRDRHLARVSVDALSPTAMEIIVVCGLLAFYLLAQGLFGEDIYATANLIGPVILTLTMITSSYHMIRNNGRILWTALFWFRVSTAAYFGVGSIVVFVVDDTVRNRMESFFQFSDHDIFKLNLVVVFSVLLVLISAKAGIGAYRRLAVARRPRASASRDDRGKGLLVSALIFFLVGMAVNYIFVIPYHMGWTTTVLPGALANFAKFTPIGIFLLTLWSLRYARPLLPLILAVVGVEMVFSILMFLKSTMLFLLIMVWLAFLWDRVTVAKLALFCSTFVATFLAIYPIVADARLEMTQRYGANTQAGFAERYEILVEGLSDGSTDRASGLDNGLARLSYVNAATFIIQLYDAGDPSDWPLLIPAVFVPRVIWPDKPVISDIGLNIYELSTNRRSSSSGAGLFAEAYWAAGWLGLVVFVPVYGFIIGFMTQFSVVVLQHERWLYAPVVLLALRMGFRTDGHYITDVAGATVILIALYVLLRVVDSFSRSLLMSSSRV